MKAKPVKLVPVQGYVACEIHEATHVTLNLPGPTGHLTLPVIQKGTRDGTHCWTWNGSTDSPTLKPSVLTEGFSSVTEQPFRCHTWINEGYVQFLSDCSHGLADSTLCLLEVEK